MNVLSVDRTVSNFRPKILAKGPNKIHPVRIDVPDSIKYGPPKEQPRPEQRIHDYEISDDGDSFTRRPDSKPDSSNNEGVTIEPISRDDHNIVNDGSVNPMVIKM